VNGAYSGAGQNGYDQFRYHAHVNGYTVARAYAAIFSTLANFDTWRCSSP